MVSANSSQSSSGNISLPPSALIELEEHDDALASICPGGMDSAAFSVDSTASFASICSFDRDDLDMVGHLGSGKYCKVDVVSASSNSFHDSSSSSDDRLDLLAHKSIDPCRLRCPNDLNIAAMELANEAKILSGLDHGNIIKLRGLSSEKFSESFAPNINTKRRGSSGGYGYFLVMDLLHETVKDRMNHWGKKEKDRARAKKRREMLRRTRNSFTKRLRKSSPSSRSKSKLLAPCGVEECQRLHNRIGDTVLGIAKGMKYLHSKNIVLRDLKPANIGYEKDDSDSSSSCSNETSTNSSSNVKLFDFGMARKVEECDPEEICGSPRYMAPEVMRKKGYTTAVDVYSFGVILYEMCSLKHPFDETYSAYRKTAKAGKRPRAVSCDEEGSNDTNTSNINPVILDFYNAVANQKIKPSADLESEVVCPKLRCLIEACWDHDPTKRPTFDTVLARLVEIFFPHLFPEEAPTNNNIRDNRENRDCTLRPSVSIEFDFDDSFDELSCSGRYTSE